MINRVLIRIKVIQILYSFLLVEKRFMIESSPSAPTKEKRFSYSLYLDMLVLLIKVSESIRRRGGNCPLVETGLISRLLADENVIILLKKYSVEPFPLQQAVEPVAEAVKESAIYKKFLKDSGNVVGSGEEHLWKNLFNIIIINDEKVRSLISQRPNYTLKGVERAGEIMNRTFVNFLASQDNVADIERALATSLDKSRELYMRLLYLIVELTDLEDRILDDNRHKYLKTSEDINPNLRFVENRIADRLRHSALLQKFVEKNKLSWLNEDPIMMRNLLKAIKESDIYRQYMEAPSCDIHSDSELWRNLLKNVILDNTGFLETLEDQSVFWNDDLEILSTFVLKTLRRLEDDSNEDAILDKYKDEEDSRFGVELLRYVYRDKDILRHYINDAVEGGSWDKDRLAFMDVVIIETALAEIQNFPKIPLNVSINEYLEIAKSYSSAKSGQFVHGLLGSIISKMQREGKILK